MKTINVNEIFLSVQGEGPLVGHPTVFVRTYGCNLNPLCPWCDTLYAIKGGDSQVFTPADIASKIQTYNCRDVTFTGGEPMMYIEPLCDVMYNLCDFYPNYKFHFETNGSLYPEKFITALNSYDVTLVISPKLHAINDLYIESIKRYLYTFFNFEISLKFVYENENTIKQIEDLFAKVPKSLMLNKQIYLMPEGTVFNKEKYIETSEACIKYGYILSARLHNIIWGNKRGV